MSAAPDPPFENQPSGISLDELAAAFAQAMGGGGRAEGPSSQAKAAPSPPVAQEPVDAEAEPADADGCCPISPRTILEAMLFVGNRDGSPLPPARAAELMRDVEPGEIAGLVDELNARYAAVGCPYHVISEGAGYRLTLRQPFHALREQFYGRIREARLSQAAIDVLAIVAYQQPVTAEQVGRLRAKPSGHVLAQLVHRRLLRIDRSGPRRTAHYCTTERFLKVFGLDSLEDLPRD